MTTSPSFPRPQFPLFSKIVAGFAFVIFFMILSSVFLLFQMNDVFSEGETEFQSLQLSQYLGRLFMLESDAVGKYFETRDTSYARNFFRINSYFQISGDSLLHVASHADNRTLIESVLVTHRDYTEYFNNTYTQIRTTSISDSSSIIRQRHVYEEKLSNQLLRVSKLFESSTLKSVKSFFQKAPIAIKGSYITLLLAFVVAIVSAIILAKAITKPIKALKMGTEKVGEGKYETVAVTTTDEVADLTRAFNMMSDKLKQLDEMRMQMMSEISHEMRTPLQVIKAGCYSIIHTKDGPVLTQRQRDAVAMIHQSSNRINAFVNSFLDVAKMEAGLMKFNFEKMNIVELLTPLIQEAQLIAQTRQITLEFLAGEIPLLSLDKERMSQVFSNLLSNALKYTPDSGKITVRLSSVVLQASAGTNGNGQVRIEVQDSGVGIPESDLARLFDKFYQAKNVPLVNEKGSGLGLALVKHVSEAHGGKVSVKSKVGEGSTFIVELPAA
jgi:two-component system sensor histidine kinase GlrK